MRVYIRNKLISLRGSSYVLNENEEPIFNVKGKLISPTKKKFIYDMEGNLLYIVRNQYWSGFTNAAFVYDGNKNKLAKIKKKFWSGKLIVEGYKDEITMPHGSGNIMRNGEPMGKVIRDISLITDRFTVEADEKDIPFCVAMVIAKDNIRDKDRKDRI